MNAMAALQEGIHRICYWVMAWLLAVGAAVHCSQPGGAFQLPSQICVPEARGMSLVYNITTDCLLRTPQLPAAIIQITGKPAVAGMPLATVYLDSKLTGGQHVCC